MNRARMFEVLHSAYVSEKAALVSQQHNQYVFNVAIDASKREIRKAIEEFYKVRVLGVQVLRRKKRIRRMRVNSARLKQRKKAYVRLAPGQRIDLAAKVE